MSTLRQAIRRLQVAAYPDPSISPEIAPLSHAYPWQAYTRWLGVQMTAQLEGQFPADALRDELEAVLAHYAPKQQFGLPIDPTTGRPYDRRATDRTLPRWAIPAIVVFWVGFLLFLYVWFFWILD